MSDESLRIFPKVRQIPGVKPPSYVLYPFEMHAKMRESFEEKEAESLMLIQNHLSEFKKCFVASSHGKDSLVMTHLVWRACNELKIPMAEVWLNHTLNTYKEEKEFWVKFNSWLGIEKQFKVFYPPNDADGRPHTVWSIAKKVGHLPNFRRMSRDKYAFKRSNTPECCDLLKKKSIHLHLKNLPKDQRYDCQFIGTRAQESQIRSLGGTAKVQELPDQIQETIPVTHMHAPVLLEKGGYLRIFCTV